MAGRGLPFPMTPIWDPRKQTGSIDVGGTPGIPSDPTTLTIVGSVLDATNLQNASDVDVVGDLALVAVAGTDRFTVVDFSTPASPSVVGSVTNGTTLNGPSAIRASGASSAVVVMSSRLTTVEFATPASPTVVGSVTDSLLDGAHDVVVSGSYAYVSAATADALVIVDVSTPASPSIVGSVTDAVLNGAWEVAVSGSYAYVSAVNSSRLVVVDISTPATPSIVGSVFDASSLDFVEGVEVSGDYVFCVRDEQFVVVDVSTKATPVIDNSITSVDWSTGFDSDRSGAFVALCAYDDDLASVVGVSDPTTPVEIDNASDASLLATPTGVAWNTAGDILVASTDNHRLTVMTFT